MNKFSRIRHHIDMKDVKERHLEEFIEKKKEEKRIAEEREAINAEYQRWKFDWRNDIKGFDHFGEGMTTQMLTGVLPSAGNAELTNLQLGLTGEGDINYGEPGLGDEAMAGEGQYTCFSNLDILDNVDEPNNTGTLLRVFDQDSKEFRNQGHGGGEHGFLLAMPGYQRGMLRNVKPLGDYNGYDKSYRQNKGLPLTQNGSDLYYHIYGKTNDELGKGYGSWNSNDGVTDNGMGVVLSFNGPGSPRYVALKAIDSTEFDTIKIHAAVASNSMVSDYRDSDGVLRDKKVQVYYWAGDHKDYVRHPSASGIYDGNKTASQDGWRPINMKPNGELDDTVDPYIIKHKADRDTHGVDANGVTYSAAGKLHPYSLPLPEYTRSKNARYIIVQTDKNNFSDDNAFALASVRFQRKNTLRVPSISKPLTDIEAAPFVRVGQGVDQNAKQRKKRVRDMINASIKYGNMKFGKGMFNSTNLDDDLEEEKKLKEEKICSRIAKKKRSNWRNDLAESDWSPVTSTIANRATQTFKHISGTTSTFAGLGGVEVHPSNITIDGENVSTPTYSDLALAGYTKPLGGVLKKQNSVKEKEINSRLDSSEKFAKKIRADKFMKARVTPPIPDEPLPPGTKWELIPASYGGIVDGQWDPDYMVAPPSWTQVYIEDPDNRYKATPDGVTQGDKEGFLNKVASQMSLGTAKRVFDHHMNFIKNPTNKPQDVTNLISSKDMNVLKSWAGGDRTFDKHFDIDSAYNDLKVFAQRTPGLKNTLGNMDLDRGDGITNITPEYIEIKKAYDFDGVKDIFGAGNPLTGSAAAVYGGSRMGVKGMFQGTPTMYITIKIPRKKRETK